VKRALGIPEEMEVASIIPIGYRKNGAKVPAPKKIDVEEHIRFNCWEA